MSAATATPRGRVARRPPALVDPRLARLAAYVALALLGSLQWVRYVEGADTDRALLWVGAGAVTGGLVVLAGRRRVLLALAALAGAALAVGASGLDLTYLEPNHVDELGAGLGRGGSALGSVRLPYTGREEWVLTTVALAGAGLCWAAALLACWPGGRGRLGALVLLLVLAASPLVSLGTDHPALLGLALALLTAAFLWAERLARRPGRSLAAFVAVAAVVAVPAGAAADREDPLFDYRAFSERLAGGTPVAYDWDHQYGPIDWDREGVELFRVDGSPRYWRVLGLSEFDNGRWAAGSPPASGAAEVDLPAADDQRDDWRTSFSVAINLLESEQLVGAGTTLSVTDETQPVESDGVPGQFVTTGDDELVEGDSYTAEAYVPAPTQEELGEATVSTDPRRQQELELDLELLDGVTVRPAAGSDFPRVGVNTAQVTFPGYESAGRPTAEFPEVGRETDAAGPVLEVSRYQRSWQLAQDLKAGTDSAYEFVVAVDDHLGGPAFRYTETPPEPAPGVPALEDFLFDSRRGYCQQYSGAMALLLRMGGVPARVATGFTPGGQPPGGGWIVRDTDAHSWVEAWFDGIGWVTFDPTPPATPARSQTAALNAPFSDEGVTSSDAAQAGASGSSIDAKGQGRNFGPGSLNPGADPGFVVEEGRPWGWIALAIVAGLALVATLAVAWRAGKRTATASGALAELDRALRRSGRASAPGTTLHALERRLGVAGHEDYLASLRAARYGTGAPAPTRRQRAAFRGRLAAELGWAGRLRALYALPPTLPRRPSARPGSSADRATAS